MAGSLADLKNLIDKAFLQLPEIVLQVFEVEGMKFISKNFRDQGFNDGSTQKWKERKTTDRQGRDITRHRSNRHGAEGSLTKYGQANIGRAILVKKGSLKNSFRSRKEKRSVAFYTHVKYAERHNEGLKGIPKRQFMGPSADLKKNIEKKITQELDKLFK